MASWLAARKNLPPKTREMLQAEADSARVARAVPDPKLPRGSGAALRRLEEMEAQSYGELQAALAIGNAIGIKLAREGWLKTSESLRRFDLVLEQHRRTVGETVSRAMVEKALNKLTWLLRIQGKLIAPQLAMSVRGLNQVNGNRLLQDTWLELILNALAGLEVIESNGIPQWMVVALRKDIGNEISCADNEINARVEVLKRANEHLLAEHEQRLKDRDSAEAQRGKSNT